MTPRTPAASAATSTAAGALPSNVVASTRPSPVTTRSAPSSREAGQLEHELGARDELGAERRERRAEPSGRAGAGEQRVGREVAPSRQPPLELLDRRRVGALLRPERPGGAARAEQRAAHVAGDRDRQREAAEQCEQAAAAVHRRRAAEADEQRVRPVVDRGVEQLAEPLARRAQRIALLRRDAAEPDRLGRLDDRGPVRQHEPARLDRPPERVGDRRAAPLAAERDEEQVGRPLAAVGDRRLHRLGACAPEPLRERGRGLAWPAGRP